MKTIKKVIDRVLNKYGYYRADMPEGAAVTQADIMEMFQSYGDNELFVRFLRDLCAQDIRMYFQASNDDDRKTIRGAHQRTNFFISLIRKSNDKRKPGGRGTN